MVSHTPPIAKVMARGLNDLVFISSAFFVLCNNVLVHPSEAFRLNPLCFIILYPETLALDIFTIIETLGRAEVPLPNEINRAKIF
jgi:hypothetical protein